MNIRDPRSTEQTPAASDRRTPIIGSAMNEDRWSASVLDQLDAKLDATGGFVDTKIRGELRLESLD